VQTTDGRTLHGRVDEPKGDPGNTLSREEITAKALRLAAYGSQVPAAQVQQAVQQLWQVAQWPRVRGCWPDRYPIWHVCGGGCGHAFPEGNGTTEMPAL
jgi:hypothetical protein